MKLELDEVVANDFSDDALELAVGHIHAANETLRGCGYSWMWGCD